MLKAMKKGITREQTIRTLTAAKEVGMHLKIQLMGGFPGETKETLAETASMMKEIGLPPRRLTWCTPLPGSELYQTAKHQGMIEDEEEYIIKLHKGYNNRRNIVLNVSGESDEEMIRLFDWVHLKMDVDYLLSMLVQPRKLSRPASWAPWVRRVLSKLTSYYTPSFYRQFVSIRSKVLALVARSSHATGLDRNPSLQ